jgi:membrane protein implicated in regulation of membrane protease activity
MFVRIQMAALIFMMAQAVLFGIGAVLVLATPLTDYAMQLMPWVVVVSVIVSLPLSWMMVPWLRTRRENRAAERAGKETILPNTLGRPT